jgi:hypothetical protein
MQKAGIGAPNIALRTQKTSRLPIIKEATGGRLIALPVSMGKRWEAGGRNKFFSYTFTIKEFIQLQGSRGSEL